ncbi:ribonuclease domain-containing protein [Deinococcus sp. YIM 134068]|uniref:ribonuclease domain-containing protein n=1 Tax=Deinococcus lichenicola TaxID=3118910 RepID=UPI002F95BEFE
MSFSHLPRFLRPLLLGGLLVACAPPDEGQATATQTVQTSTTTRATRDPQSGLPLLTASDLPREARRTLTLIRVGGPFPYAKDGSTFGNREGILPRQRRGYYREYTVPTPGEDDRGARRLVCGGPVRAVDECYYTADHYRSFGRVQP